MKIKSLIALITVFVFLFAFPAKADAAAKIYFDPSTYTTSSNTDFSVKVQLDAESNATFGADATINYNSSEVTLKSVDNGNFFSDFSSAKGTGVVEIHGSFLSAQYQTKTGAGIFATLVFTPIKTSGTGAVSFSCDGTGNDTEILNGEGSNILNCSSTNQLNINFSSSSQSSGGTNDTNAGGPTNSCGGTCGSHYNCNAGLFCSNGFCRNPDCPSSATCGCTASGTTATVKPKATTKASPKASIKPTPQVIALKKYTPAPLVLPTEKPADQIASASKLSLKAVALWSGILLLLLVIWSIVKKYLKKHKGKNLPPDIPSSPPPIMPPPFLPPDMGPPDPPSPMVP